MFGDRKSSFSLKRTFCRSIVTRYILLDSVFGEGYSRHSSLTAYFARTLPPSLKLWRT